MNLFKGLLFLHGYITRPDAFDGEPRRYGAATVAGGVLRRRRLRLSAAARAGRRGRTSVDRTRTAPRPGTSLAAAG